MPGQSLLLLLLVPVQELFTILLFHGFDTIKVLIGETLHHSVVVLGSVAKYLALQFLHHCDSLEMRKIALWAGIDAGCSW